MYSQLSAQIPVSALATMQPAAPQVSQVPGVKGGIPPQQPVAQNAAAQQSAFPSMPTGSFESMQAELDKFKPALDTNGKPIAQADFSLVAPQIPEHAKFKEIAQKLTSQVQIDQTKLAAALGGDTGAFSEVLQNAMEQAMQHTMAITTSMAGTLAHNQASQVLKVAQAQVADSATEQASIDAAVSVNPQFGTSFGANLLKNQIKELRKQFPTAPAKLLGEYAASQLAQLSGGQQQGDENDPMARMLNQPQVDWSSQFGMG